MQIQSDFLLKDFNTFGLEVKAASFARLHHPIALQEILQSSRLPVLILGGGSNILFTKDPEYLVIHNEIDGIEIVEQGLDEVIVKVGAGVVWHRFVMWCLAHGLGGVENLSLIPGTVGAAPIQNIGAYGVEIKDVFYRLDGIEIESGKLLEFNHFECNFGYRDSIFKHEMKSKLCITYAYFKLTKQNHLLNYSYGAIHEIFGRNNIVNPSIQDISNAVIEIRSSKLPDPKLLGNAGSFFKNPEISITLLDKIKELYPNIPFYPINEITVKIPAGWLIEQRGWKGKKMGNCGAHINQALVLVNYGGATGKEIASLAYTIIDDVEQHFGIRLTPEVNII